MSKKISIIVPIYNQEKYLCVSIPSILNQRYSNLEIVLVNDGSTDSSREIIERYKQQDSRIVAIDKTNGGLVDATIAGIKHATGDFIAFLDPDDYIGEDYLKYLLDSMGEADIVASGFFFDNNGKLEPYFLEKDYTYIGDELELLTKSFLASDKWIGIPHTLFFSRWNKLYRKSLIDKVVLTFEKYTDLSLGEDSIFTFIALANATSVKTIGTANTYFYNIGNQNSMMKTGATDKYLLNAKKAFEALSQLEAESNICGSNNRFALYYYLVESCFQRTLRSDYSGFKHVFKSITKDDQYKETLNYLQTQSMGRIKRIDLFLRKHSWAYLYFFIFSVLYPCIKKIKNKVVALRKSVTVVNESGIMKGILFYKHQVDRINAFNDMRKLLPRLDEIISEYLDDYKGKTTDISKDTLNKNVFIFWWDGFDNAPDIVQLCRKSIYKYFSDSNIVEISKNNYMEYTNIPENILRGFEAGRISIQTFSDILRFNLLRENGGVWIDSTICFLSKFDIFENLKEKPIESVAFASSASFLEYRDISCSWSGYFIASHKNSIFSQAMCTIFERYYSDYKTYSLYFFIDAALMICKKNGIDGGCLDKVQFSNGDMFLLEKVFNHSFDEVCFKEMQKVPQKLAWSMLANKTLGTFYDHITEYIQ